MNTLESSLLTYLLNSLWQVPLVFVAAWLASRLARRSGPAFQHRLWVAALLAEVLLPTCSTPPLHALQALLYLLLPLNHATAPQGPQVTVTMGPAHAEGGLHLAPALLTVVALLYIGTMIYFAARLCFGIYRTASLRRRAEPIALTGDASQSYERYARVFGVHNAVVAVSPEIASPITLGIRRRMLLLPAAIDAGLLGEDLDAAIAHELAHMRRRDFAKNLVYELLSLPIAFHPLLWLTRRRVAASREILCDAMAAEAVAGPQRYARSLLRLASIFSQPTHATTSHAIGIFDANQFHNFERRVMNLTNQPIELKGARRIATAAGILFLACGACTSALAFRMQVAAPTPTQTISVTAQSTPDATHKRIDTEVRQTVDTEVRRAVNNQIMVAIPRPTTGEPAKSFKIDVQPLTTVADASPTPMIIKVLTPAVIDGDQTTADGPARIASGVMAGNRLTYVNPVYPPEAKAAGIQGTVLLSAVIGKDGNLAGLKLISGPAELTKSAWAAVTQWTWKPYLLNGEPTTVETTITVNYSLDKHK